MKKVKVGAAFSDFVYTEKNGMISMPWKGKGSSGTDVKWRMVLFPFLISISVILLLGRLFYIQVFHGGDYRLLSDTNRTRTTIIHAPRGVIFDRNGKPLVYNSPGFRRVTDGKTEFIDNKTGIQLLAKGEKGIEIDSLRSYPLKDAAAHIVGYIGEISPEELQDPTFTSYRVGDVIGKMGIEQYYENKLRGIDGQKLVEVDAIGNVVRTLGETDPIPGQNITLTLDSNLQMAVFEAMKDVKKGAAIVTNPKGEVLAMVSKPSFDPNLFTLGSQYTIGTESAYTTVSQVLLDGDGQPLLDRVIGGTYPPGSTFKLVTAAAGLETKTIDKNYTIDDTGIVHIGAFSFANWYYTDYGRTEGTVDVVKAIKRSNDIFFYKVGELLGVDSLSAFATKMGLGSPLGIDLVGERKGLVPTKEWKLKTIGEQWYTGDDYHYGIGQGFLLTTPLQVNYWTQLIGNEGIGYQPHVLKSQHSQVKVQNILHPENFSLIREGMIEACQTGGVAWPFFNFGIQNPNANVVVDGKNFYDMEATGSGHMVGVSIACKTGTAQHGGEDTLPHSWITLFAPAYNPQIIVTILAESSGEGSNIAGPIAKKIVESYFSK